MPLPKAAAKPVTCLYFLNMEKKFSQVDHAGLVLGQIWGSSSLVCGATQSDP